MPHKLFYRIQEVSELLSIPTTTLRWWEEVFPMFNPNRLPSGQRRFTREDVRVAGMIKELVYIKGLKVDAAIEMMNKTCRKSLPRKRPECSTLKKAIKLLDEVKAVLEDTRAIAKIEAVDKFLNTLGDVEKRTGR